MTADRSQAMDHVVVIMFENRSLDNLLGHLYGPEDGKTFEGVIGKDLSNPIPTGPSTVASTAGGAPTASPPSSCPRGSPRANSPTRSTATRLFG